MEVRLCRVALAVLVVVPVAACSQGPAADAQDTPENLVATVLELREQGHPEQAARYFINGEVKREQLDQLTTVSHDILCSAEGVNCDNKGTNNSYWGYLHNKECEGTTAADVREKGVELEDDDKFVEVKGTRDAGNVCAFDVAHIDGKWWLRG